MPWGPVLIVMQCCRYQRGHLSLLVGVTCHSLMLRVMVEAEGYCQQASRKLRSARQHTSLLGFWH